MGTMMLIFLFGIIIMTILKEKEKRKLIEELVEHLSTRMAMLEKSRNVQAGTVQKIADEVERLKKKIDTPAKKVETPIQNVRKTEPRKVTVSVSKLIDPVNKKTMECSVKHQKEWTQTSVRPEPIRAIVNDESSLKKPVREKTTPQSAKLSTSLVKQEPVQVKSESPVLEIMKEQEKPGEKIERIDKKQLPIEKSLSKLEDPLSIGITAIRTSPNKENDLKVKKVYTEKASRLEMVYAGTYLNYIGIVFLVTGVLTFLTVTLSPDLSDGLLQCIAGISLGILMILTGYYLHIRNMQKFSHIVVAGGFSILFFTVCAMYFRYHLIGEWHLFLSIFVIVASSGISIFRLDSKFIGNSMLIAVFLAPAFMKFSFSGVKIISFYLIAVNLGIAYVAYYKKWDYYLIVSFVATYLLYFRNFHFSQPEHALGFLIVIYLLYLFSNNILHFTRKTSNGYHLVLSYINPTVFAAVSYFILIKMANIWATLVYLAMAAIHLCLTKKARRLEEKDVMFTNIVNNNLILGLLFLTASISFVTYFSNTTTYFPVVIALWFIEAYVLYILSFRISNVEKILRRYSYFSLLLATAQLYYVIPTMRQSLGTLIIYLVSCAGYFYYFIMLYIKRTLVDDEEKYAMTFSLLSSIAVITHIIYKFSIDAIYVPVMCGLVSHLLLYVSMRYFAEYARLLKRFSLAFLSLFTCHLLLTFTSAGHALVSSKEFMLCLISFVLYSGYFLFLYRHRTSIESEMKYAMTLCLVASFATLTYGVHEAFIKTFYLPILYGVLSYFTLYVSIRHLSEYAKIFKRFSYAYMILFSCYLPTMLKITEPFVIISKDFMLCLVSLAMYSVYFSILYRQRLSLCDEERYAMTVSFLGSLAILFLILYKSFAGTVYLPFVSGLLSHIALYVSLRHLPEYSKLMRRVSFLLMIFLSYSLFQTVSAIGGEQITVLSAKFILYIVSSTIYFLYFLSLYRNRGSLGDEERYYMAITALTSIGVAGYLLTTLSNSAIYLKVCATLISAGVLYVSLRYFDVMLYYHKLAFLGLSLVTLNILFSGFMMSSESLLLFLNKRFTAMMFIAFIYLFCYIMLRKSESRIPAYERWTIGAIPYMIMIILMKTFLMEMPGSGSTVIWSLMGLALLYYSTKNSQSDVFRLLSAPMSLKGLASYSSNSTSRENVTAVSYLIFFVTFLKTVVFDSNFIYKAGRIDIPAPGTLHGGEIISILILTVVYISAARLVWKSYDTRNLLVALGLFIFSFQSSFVLYKLWGVWDYFQTILSVYWSIVAFTFIAYGIYRELKVFRLFGLILLSASILKIGFVDLWVLSYNNRVITFTILGVIMMITSFLYQKNRNTIADKSHQIKKLVIDPA